MLIRVALVGAILAALASPCYAGPCSADIDATQAQIDAELEAEAAAGKTAKGIDRRHCPPSNRLQAPSRRPRSSSAMSPASSFARSRKTWRARAATTRRATRRVARKRLARCTAWGD